jgi:hypothetical protein
MRARSPMSETLFCWKLFECRLQHHKIRSQLWVTHGSRLWGIGRAPGMTVFVGAPQSFLIVLIVLTSDCVFCEESLNRYACSRKKQTWVSESGATDWELELQKGNACRQGTSWLGRPLQWGESNRLPRLWCLALSLSLMASESEPPVACSLSLGARATSPCRCD